MIDFFVFRGDKLYASEEAIRLGPAWAGEFDRAWDVQGEWVLRDPESELEVRWGDALVPLMSAVCLDTIPSLARTGHGRATRLTEYGYLRLDVEGDWIRVGGDGLTSGRVPRTPFLHGQLGSVGRLVTLLTVLGLDGFDTRALREDRRTAMEALAAAQWPEGPDGFPEIPAAAPRRDAEGEVRFDPATLTWHCDQELWRLPGTHAAWAEQLETVRALLIAGDPAVAPLGERYGYARFDPEGEMLRLSGDGLSDLRLPLAGFLQSLDLRATE